MAINTNDLFDAISMIADSNIRKYKYDRTIEAKIISTAQRKDGIYKVEFEGGKFDAYSADDSTYYDKETVYVMIPEGDLTKQKYIVGRKVTTVDDKPTFPFSFKMPFDNFVGLRNLTYNNPFGQSKGYLANCPKHGFKAENETTYTEIAGSLSTEYSSRFSELNTRIESINIIYNILKNKLDSRHIGTQIHSSALDNYTFTSEDYLDGLLDDDYLVSPGQTPMEVLVDLIENQFNNEIIYVYLEDEKTYAPYYDLLTRYLNGIQFFADTTKTYNDYQFTDSDYTYLKYILDRTYEFKKQALQSKYNALIIEYNDKLSAAYRNLSVTDAQINHLWSWVNPNPTQPIIETKMGIGIDVKTLLSSIGTRSGVYGLRIEVSGMLKPTEEKKAELSTEIIYFTNEDMYGNTYAFYEPVTQQKIFDISAFLTINTIDIFFYQNHSFYDSFGGMIQYSNPQTNDITENMEHLLPSNIIITDLNVLFGLTVDECQTDRVFLYTYDDIEYGHDPLSYQTEYAAYREHINQLRSEYTEDTLQDLIDKEIAIHVGDANYAWLFPKRTLQFAWVHLTDNGPVLITRHQPKSDSDVQALRYWEKANHVQINWYHYEYGCAQDTNNIIEKQGGVNWKYIGSTPLYSTPITNYNYPDEYNEDFGKLEVMPDINKAHEQWKAIIAGDNIQYITEPLVFNNIDTSVITNTTDMLNEVTFRLLREDTHTITDTNETVTNIIEDNTLRDFYVYDENNNVLKDQKNISYASRWYYIQIWIRNNDNGEYLPMTYDANLGDIDINWQFPTQNTMIETWDEVTEVELASTELAPYQDGLSKSYNDQLKKITKRFRIKSRLDMRYTNNTISATVKRHNKTYNIQIELHFDSSGNQGSQFNITLQQLTPEGSYLVKDQLFTIVANVSEVGKSAQESSNQLYQFQWECLTPTIFTKSANESYDESDTNLSKMTGKLSDHVLIENGAFFLGNKISGYIRNDIPPIFKVTVLNAADYPLSYSKGFRLVDSAETAETYAISCPNRVEFKSDGTAPIVDNSYFIVENITTQDRTEIYPEWFLSQYRLNASNSFNLVSPPDYLELQKHSIPAQILNTNYDYLMWYKYKNPPEKTPDLDGQFGVVSDQQYLDENTYGLATYKELLNAIQADYDEQMAQIASSLVATDIAKIAEIKAQKSEREMALAAGASTVVPSYDRYSLSAYKNINAKVPWYWNNNMIEYFSILYWMKDGHWFRQAIPFARNVYSSSLLNSWDGHLLIDEKENSIMAQMISAGTKNNDNNTFTGVIMGNWQDKGDSSLDVPGLYGYEKGSQVYGFRTNGTGFIGASGKGQIVFDGNQALISNKDKTMYLNLNPNTFEVSSEGQVSINDYKGFSPYFLYAETKRSHHPTTLNESELFLWANKFVEDKSKDFFIVDPNNGILTSGGIIADYGKIGNWIISRNGLYQSYAPVPNENSRLNRFMYLGYPSMPNQDAQESSILTAYQNSVNNLKDAKERDLNTLYQTYLESLVNFVGDYYKNIFVYDPLHYYNWGWPYESLIKALNDTITEYNLNHDANIQDIFETQFTLYLGEEKRGEIHKHYTSTGQFSGWYNYGGVASTIAQLINNVSIHSSHTSAYLEGKEEIEENLIFTYKYTVDFDHSMDENLDNNYNWSFYAHDNYYASLVPEEGWEYQWSNYHAPKVTANFINTNNLNINDLIQLRNWATAYYNYMHEAYMRQLNDMLVAGLEELKETEAYQDYLTFKDQAWNKYVNDKQELINNYIELEISLNQKVENSLNQLTAEDADQYAIFAGYNKNIEDALFTVDWRGHMMARSGTIGRENPWYINDYGLMQTVQLTGTENFSTIFLGDSKMPTDKTLWEKVDPKDITTLKLLPNDSSGDFAGPNVAGYTDHPDADHYGEFAIYAGGTVGSDWIWNEALNQYVLKHTRDKSQINFGVRTDGTLYSRLGQIGGWRITDRALYSTSYIQFNGEPEKITLPGTSYTIKAPAILLDSFNGQINIGNGRTILYPDGHISLQSVLGNQQNAYIDYACFTVAGTIPGYTQNTNMNIVQTTTGIAGSSGNEYAAYGEDYTISTNYTGEYNHNVTISGCKVTQYEKLANDIKSFKSSFSSEAARLFTITTNHLAEYEQPSGIHLAVIRSHSVLYPVNTTNLGTLGTTTHKWNLWASAIEADSINVASLAISNDALYIAGDKAATQKWVLNLYYELANKIKQATTGTSYGDSGSSMGGLAGGINSGFSGANQLGTNLVNLFNNLEVLGSKKEAEESSIQAWPQWSNEAEGYHVLKVPLVKFSATTSQNGGNEDGAEFELDETTASITFHATKIATYGTCSFLNPILGTSGNAFAGGYEHQKSVNEVLESIFQSYLICKTEVLVGSDSSNTPDVGTIRIKLYNGSENELSNMQMDIPLRTGNILISSDDSATISLDHFDVFTFLNKASYKSDDQRFSTDSLYTYLTAANARINALGRSQPMDAEVTTDTDGKVTFTWKNYNGAEISGMTVNFNQADTRFFKYRAFKEMTVGGKTYERSDWTEEGSLGTINFGGAGWDSISRVNGPVSSSYYANSSYKTIRIDYNIEHAFGSTLISGTIVADAKEAYEAGWRDAAERFQRDDDTIYGPGLNPDDRDRFYTASINDSHYADIDYDDYYHMPNSGSYDLNAGDWMRNPRISLKGSVSINWS